jgi:hypothetical protein
VESKVRLVLLAACITLQSIDINGLTDAQWPRCDLPVLQNFDVRESDLVTARSDNVL